MKSIDNALLASLPQRICVLGGGGFLGSHLVNALLDAGVSHLEAIDLNFDKLGRNAKALRKTQADIATPELIQRIVAEYDVVISTTALCNPALYNTRPVDVINANYSDLVPLVEGCAQQKKWLIHFSTCEVYGHSPHDNLGVAQAMREDETRLCLGPVHRERWSYACAKQLLERLIFAFGKHHGLPFTIIRPFNVIGPRMDFIDGIDGEGVPRVLACFMRALLDGQPLKLVDGGHNRRAFMSADDFVQALVRVLLHPQTCTGQILNVGNPDNDVSIAELAETLRQQFAELEKGDPLHAIENISAEAFYGSGYEDVVRRIPDIGKMRQLIKWQPEQTLAQMLPAIIHDYVRRYGAHFCKAKGR